MKDSVLNTRAELVRSLHTMLGEAAFEAPDLQENIALVRERLSRIGVQLQKEQSMRQEAAKLQAPCPTNIDELTHRWQSLRNLAGTEHIAADQLSDIVKALLLQSITTVFDLLANRDADRPDTFDALLLSLQKVSELKTIDSKSVATCSEIAKLLANYQLTDALVQKVITYLQNQEEPEQADYALYAGVMKMAWNGLTSGKVMTELPEWDQELLLSEDLRKNNLGNDFYWELTVSYAWQRVLVGGYGWSGVSEYLSTLFDGNPVGVRCPVCRQIDCREFRGLVSRGAGADSLLAVLSDSVQLVLVQTSGKLKQCAETMLGFLDARFTSGSESRTGYRPEPDALVDRCRALDANAEEQHLLLAEIYDGHDFHVRTSVQQGVRFRYLEQELLATLPEPAKLRVYVLEKTSGRGALHEYRDLIDQAIAGLNRSTNTAENHQMDAW